jgi:hypothetical protein
MKQNEREEYKMTNEERAVIEAAEEIVQWVTSNDARASLTSSRLCAAVLALRAARATPPAPAPETREVRIAVAIDTNGNAGVAVVTYGDDAEALQYAGEWTDTLITAQGIVTARIPVIAIPVVAGTVEAV